MTTRNSTATLLLEIGTEEIPAGYIQPALDGMAALIDEKLSAARIDHGAPQTYGTPRRLAVLVPETVLMQAALATEILGPPRRVAFDDAGQPTMAAVKFAEKVGLPVDQLEIKTTAKGEYLSGIQREDGQPTLTLLTEILPQIVLTLPFPKTMRWGVGRTAFARPIQTLLALLGETVVPFAVEGIPSGNQVLGHRFLAPGPLTIKQPEDYVDQLADAYVLADVSQRQRMVADGIQMAVQAQGGVVIEDGALVDTVTNLIEFPAVVAGQFDTKFLELPREILITSMREHQKYFAIADTDGGLRPGFVVVNNTAAKDMNLVVAGHERVLRARLEDAMFFYKNDCKATFDQWNQKLQGVLFQAQLGSVRDKVQRVTTLAGLLADLAGLGPETHAQVVRAAELCKADLVSQVVVEFTKLQGIMGRVYALLAGEAQEVATAVEEHYRPTQSGGALPTSPVGALVSLADKIDTLCGCFSIGLIPTGAADPYALRRQTIGILQIMRDQAFGFDLQTALHKGLGLVADCANRSAEETGADLMTFVQNRLSGLMAETGLSKDVVQAVIGAGISPVLHVWQRAAALQTLKQQPDFEPLAVAFKRVVNILKKADLQGIDQVDRDLLKETAEKGLLTAFEDTLARVQPLLSEGEFEAAMLAIADLRPHVDRFFDDVMVMAEDMRVRNNRLALLKLLADLFGTVADFSKLTT